MREAEEDGDIEVRAAKLAPQVPKTDGVKMVAYDSARFGVAERKRLAERWEREVSVLPR